MSCDSYKIKHLHFIRREEYRPSKDCLTVLYSSWYVVVPVMKGCVWISVTIGIIADLDYMSSPKYWTITWAPVNFEFWHFHHALEWCQSFFVDERKYKSTGWVSVSTTRTWIGNKQYEKFKETKGIWMLSVEVKTYRLCRSLSTKKYKQTEIKKIECWTSQLHCKI